MSYTLYIKPDNLEIYELYQNHISFYHPGDSGLDLLVLEDTTFELHETKLVNTGIKCQMKDEYNNDVSYYLYPRSSISTKTPLILKNSVGIIDAGYRGNIMGALYYAPSNISQDNFTLQKDQRILQICAPDLKPFKIVVLEEDQQLNETERGEGGFGSTN